MSKLLPNLPIEDLTPEKDYLNIIDKGHLIKTFLESSKEEFAEIKMFVLYGEWGSGKSTLMKYLKNELEESFNTFFFQAWEYESDANLSLSLLEYLTNKSKSVAEDVSEEIVEIATKLFRGFTKSVRLSIPGLSVDVKPIVESLEQEKEKTFLQLKQEFKTEFVRWETLITKGKKPKYNIVFIDDLDRCEPENALNLLSALKLFFTYGQKTIFFCGIDKKAVEEAVRTKYGEVVKSNEYLEKIFDISFSMPRENEVLKLVRNYFPNSRIKQKEIEDNWDQAITSFFKEIKFLNPRRVKKVLNKYQLLRFIKDTQDKSVYIKSIPNIFVREDDDSSFFETILVIYFIILEEFYPKLSNRLFDINLKKSRCLKCIEDKVGQKSHLVDNTKNYFDSAGLDLSLKNLALHINQSKPNHLQRAQFFACICPIEIERIEGDFLINKDNLKNLIPQSESIDYLIYRYILLNDKIFINCEVLSDLALRQIKNMVTKLL